MNSWLKNAVFYEIYPQSFKDTNSDGIGDFNGIIEKLDYIKSIGFNAIWMNPCFLSPFSDAGYDVEDFYQVAPRYGTNDDIKRLFDEIHKRDMHILLDLVPGHTAVTCKWFKESMKPEKNEYSGRYIWTDVAWKRIDDIPAINGSLRGISQRDACCAVNYYSTQPALNYGFAKITDDTWQCTVDSEDAVSTRNELINIICFWLGLGCDGFRVDMAASLVKNDEGRKVTIKLWQYIFKQVKEKFPDSAFIAEWGYPKDALEAGFDMVFLLHYGPTHYMDLFRTETPYFAKSAKGDASEFFKTYFENLEATNGKGLMCIISGNHDFPRIAQTLTPDEIKLAYALIMALPGAPFIYYGDEIGMRYLKGIPSVEGGYERTGSRTPMQWDSTPNSGFSCAPKESLYIMIDPDENRPTVEKSLADENSILNEMKKQIAVRLAHTQLQSEAEIAPVFIEKSAYPLVFTRGGEHGILIAINPSEKVCAVNTELEAGKVLYSLNGAATISDGKITVPPCSATYIKLK